MNSLFFNTLLLLKSVRISQLFENVLKELQRRIWSIELSYIFDYDLTKNIEIPIPSIPVSLREIREDDVRELLAETSNKMNGIEFKSRLARLLFLRSGIPTCYVGVNSDDKPLVMLWLITPDFNKKIQHYFKGGIQPLRPDEVLCEFVYVHPNYRGYRLHTWCQLSLFSKAQAQGARKAFAYVSIDNATSMHATRRFGWEPCVTKVVKRRLFTKKIAFTLCASHMPRLNANNSQEKTGIF